MKQRIYIINEAKKIKSDNFTRSNREKLIIRWHHHYFVFLGVPIIFSPTLYVNSLRLIRQLLLHSFSDISKLITVGKNKIGALKIGNHALAYFQILCFSNIFDFFLLILVKLLLIIFFD